MITYGQRLAETFSQVGKRFRKGAGPMLDIGVYPLTVATTILGPVARVWGLAGIAIPEREIATGPLAGQRFAVEVPDHVTGLLQFAHGTIGTSHASFAVAKTCLPAVEVHGTAGSLWLSDKQRFDATVRVCLAARKSGVRSPSQGLKRLLTGHAPLSIWRRRCA